MAAGTDEPVAINYSGFNGASESYFLHFNVQPLAV